MNKKCNKCLKIKDTKEFGNNISTKDNLASRCKECVNIYNCIYRRINKEKNIDIIINNNSKKVCSYCKEEKYLFEFVRIFRNKNGVHENCKLCHNKFQLTNLIKMKEIVYNYYGNYCANCNEKDTEILSVDHINNDGAAERRKLKNSKNLYRKIIKENFPDTYQILCYNCNMKKHRNGGVLINLLKSYSLTEYINKYAGVMQ